MKLLDIFTQNGVDFYPSQIKKDVVTKVKTKIDDIDFNFAVTVTCHGLVNIRVSNDLSNFGRSFNIEYQRYPLRNDDTHLWFNNDYSLNNNKDTPEAVITMSKMNIAIAELMIHLRDDEKFLAAMKAQSEYFDMIVQKREEEDRKIKEEEMRQRKVKFEEGGHSFIDLKDIKKALKQAREASSTAPSRKVSVIFSRVSKDFEKSFVRVTYTYGEARPVVDTDTDLDKLEQKNIRMHRSYRSNVKDVHKKLENQAYSVVKEYEVTF